MKDMVEFVAKSLVHDPESVVVLEEGVPGRRVITLKVTQDDMGRVIGKDGRIAQAMRVLLKVSAAQKDGGGQPLLVIGGTGEEGQAVPDNEDANIPEEPEES
ncbi:MAG: KH domain-containing protein [Dehalococcoidia bacterium]|nr:KH domain-containing protein [Dehalococcoidia bacterium]